MQNLAIERIDKLTTYVAGRREEQIGDNEVRVGSRSIGTAIGVDYHGMRKEAAAILRRNIHCFNDNGRSFYYLSEFGKLFYGELMSTGIASTTVRNWLKKYQNFNETLFTTF